ncbi:MAG: DUF4260 domain-containing protein [Gemmatimonadaceae bacterium]
MHPVGAPIRSLLRLEASAVSLAGLLVWVGMDGSWGWFALLILAPDVSLVGYLWGNRAGAAFYNIAHTYAVPLLLAVAGVVFDQRAMVLTGTLWLTHIGIDRALGFGLKYASSFQHTHLGNVGRVQLPHPMLPQAMMPQAVMRTGEHLVQLLQPNEVVRPSAAQNATQHTVAR